MKTQLSRAEKLDRLFGTPAFAVIIAILCNAMWGSAFPFIKLGYRLFAIDTADTASILCFAGVRFMLGSVLVLGGSLLLEGRLPAMPKGKILAECCALGLWQTTAQYAFFYSAVALLTGAFGGILNSTQSFLGVIFAHFLYGRADRMTPAKALGCGIGFAGVLIATLGNHGGGSARGVAYMLIATVLFTLAGPWNKSVTRRADSFAVCFVNLFVGGAALFLLGAVLGGRLEHWSVLSVLDLLALAFICGAGYIVWALLMKNNPVSRIAIFGFVNPVVNVLLSALINGEPLFRWQYLGALVLVCIGIWLVNKAPPKRSVPCNMEYPIFDTHAHYSARAFDADRFALLDSLPGKGWWACASRPPIRAMRPRCWSWPTNIPGCTPPSASIRRACWPRRIAVRRASPLLSRYTAATGPQRCAPLPPITRTPRWWLWGVRTGLPLARAQGCPAGAV